MKWLIEGFGGGMKKELHCEKELHRAAIRVCPLIDHGEQPMKMHTEVTFYKLNSYKKLWRELFNSDKSKNGFRVKLTL